MSSLAALALAAVASNPSAGAAPSPAPPPPLALAGTWHGREVAGAVGVRYPRVTFADSGGSLAYEDSERGSGAMSVRVEDVSVKGETVRFSVRGPGQPRYYRGRWDGRRITGTISAAPSGPEIGTFELARPIYDDTPRLPMMAATRPPSRRSAPYGTVSTEQEPPRFEVFQPLRFEADRARETGTRRVAARFAQVSGAVEALDAMMDEYSSQCPVRGTPLSEAATLPPCDRMLSYIGRVAAAVKQALDEAEDDARRSQVQPGIVRDLRARHGVDDGDWARVSDRLRQLEAEAARQPR